MVTKLNGLISAFTIYFGDEFMGKQQSGFTLIELVAVIVILGILAATAVPRFVDLQDEASQAAVNGIAGSLESASALNHAVAVAVNAGLTTLVLDPFYSITDCDEAGVLLQNGKLPGDTGTPLTDPYTIAALGVGAGQTSTCTLSGTNGKDATFVIIGTTGGTTPP